MIYMLTLKHPLEKIESVSEFTELGVLKVFTYLVIKTALSETNRQCS